MFRQNGLKEEMQGWGEEPGNAILASLKARLSVAMPPPTEQGLHVCCQSHTEGHREGNQTEVGGEPEVPRFSTTRCCLYTSLLPPKSCAFVLLGVLADIYIEIPGRLS